MNATFRCPACKNSFSAEAAPELVCPDCSVRFAPALKKAAAGARAAAPTPAAGTKSFNIQRTCAGCGAKYPGEQAKCPECGAGYTAAKIQREEAATGGAFGAEKRGIRAGVTGGIVMIVIAAVWFLGGLAMDRIFFYPPILAVIGVYAVIKGLATGNIAGEKARPRRGRAR